MALKIIDVAPGMAVTYIGGPHVTNKNAAEWIGRRATVVKVVKTRKEVVIRFDGKAQPYWASVESLAAAS